MHNISSKRTYTAQKAMPINNYSYIIQGQGKYMGVLVMTLRLTDIPERRKGRTFNGSMSVEPITVVSLLK